MHNEAQKLTVEYALKGGNTLTVEKKYSTNIAKVTYDDKSLLITFRNGDLVYTYTDTKSVVKRLFDKFVDKYLKIKNGGEKERTKYSLGKFANELNKIYPK